MDHSGSQKKWMSSKLVDNWQQMNNVKTEMLQAKRKTSTFDQMDGKFTILSLKR